MSDINKILLNLFLILVLLYYLPSHVEAATLSWNTFLGGSVTDQVRKVITDSSGNIYVVGYGDATWGSPVSAYSANHDGFLAKLDSSGNLVWNTFIGATGQDIAYDIALGSDGSIYVTGYSSSTWGSPIVAFNAVEDGFAAKFDSSGNLVWNTFLGGAGQDEAYGILLDSSGNIYVLVGLNTATWGSPVRVYSSGIEGGLVKLDSSGNLLWNTFIGGSGGDFSDALAVDAQNNVFVLGYGNATWGSPINAFSSGFDGYITKIDSSGNLLWNTFFGGSGNELAYLHSLKLDGGNIYVTGYSTATWGAPIRAYVSGDESWLAKFTSSGTLSWNTFFGGSGTDQVKGMDVGSDGVIYTVGYSTATWGSPLNAYTAGDDGFVTKHDSNGSLLWNTFLGGSDNDRGGMIEVDGDNNLVVGGIYSTATWGSPVRAYTSGQDAFVVEYDNDPIISSVASVTSKTGSTITWTTNEGSSTKVDYGISSYDSSTSETDTGSSRATSHSVSLSGLADCTRYQYRVRSIDSASNETVSGDGSFSTMCAQGPNLCSSAVPSGELPFISSVVPAGSGELDINFANWQTPITHFSLEYGLAPGSYIYGVENIGDSGADAFRVSSLKPNVTYYFRIITKNSCASGGRSNEVSAKTGGYGSASATEDKDVEKSKEGSEIRPNSSATPEAVNVSPTAKNIISIFFNWVTFLFRKLLGKI